MAKKTPAEVQAEEVKKQEAAKARFDETVAESQAELAKELIPCPVCGTTVARGEVCAVDGHKSGGEPAL